MYRNRISHFTIYVLSYLCFSCNNTHDSYLENVKEDSTASNSEYNREYSSEHKINIIQNDTIEYSKIINDNISDTDKIVAESFEYFAIDKLDQLTLKINKSFVFSPLNASLTFSLMNNATSENKRKAINDYLKLPDNHSIEYSNEYNRKVIENIQKELDNTDSEVAISNKIWVKKESDIYRSFISALNSYDADIEGVDFDSRSDREKIDSNVRNNSNYSDASLSIEYEENMNALFANSIRFSLQWEKKLQRYEDEKFTTHEGKIVPCETIGGFGKFKYVDLGYYCITEIPYVDSDFSMYIIYTPCSDDRYLNVLNNIITQGGIDECIQQMEESILDFKFPVFSVENTMSLMEPDKSELKYYSKVSPNSFTLNSVSQICALKVDENGTSAKAIIKNDSDEDFIVQGTPEASFIELYINSSFWFIVRNNKLKTILFAGCIK